MKFGGPKELTGGVDLISRYKLLAYHDFYCKRTLPFSLLDAHYLHNIVGDTDIRKGDGMQLDELVRQSPSVKETNSRIQPFDLDVLRDAFQLHESAHVDLAPDEMGVPTVGSKLRSRAAKDKEKKHRKHKEKEKRRTKKEKKEKHSHIYPIEDKEKEMKNKNGHLDPAHQLHNRPEKKRKHVRDEDLIGKKKSKRNQSFAAQA